MLDQLTVEDFTPRLEDTFRLEMPDGGSMQLRLIEAVAMAGTATHREPFSLLFEGAPEPILDERLEIVGRNAPTTRRVGPAPADQSS